MFYMKLCVSNSCLESFVYKFQYCLELLYILHKKAEDSN